MDAGPGGRCCAWLARSLPAGCLTGYNALARVELPRGAVETTGYTLARGRDRLSTKTYPTVIELVDYEIDRILSRVSARRCLHNFQELLTRVFDIFRISFRFPGLLTHKLRLESRHGFQSQTSFFHSVLCANSHIRKRYSPTELPSRVNGSTAGGAYPCLGPARRAITTDQPTPSVRNMRKTSLASEWSPQMDAVSVEIRAYGELEVRRVAGRHRHLEEATR